MTRAEKLISFWTLFWVSRDEFPKTERKYLILERTSELTRVVNTSRGSQWRAADSPSRIPVQLRMTWSTWSEKSSDGPWSHQGWPRATKGHHTLVTPRATLAVASAVSRRRMIWGKSHFFPLTRSWESSACCYMTLTELSKCICMSLKKMLKSNGPKAVPW